MIRRYKDASVCRQRPADRSQDPGPGQPFIYVDRDSLPHHIAIIVYNRGPAVVNRLFVLFYPFTAKIARVLVEFTCPGRSSNAASPLSEREQLDGLALPIPLHVYVQKLRGGTELYILNAPVCKRGHNGKRIIAAQKGFG